MIVVKVLLSLIFVTILTIVTQVGGIVFLISLLTYGIINKRFGNAFVRTGCKAASCLILYLLTTFLVVPLAAKPFGRVRLPLFETKHLKPGNMLTFLLNRNYVRLELEQAIFDVSERMNEVFPGIVLNYLDASFPFIDGFPLPPHLSHNDGKKLDISFVYLDKLTGQRTNEIPSFIGYGICEGPVEGEENMPKVCDQKGNWQYSMLPKIVGQSSKEKFQFDSKAVKTLVELIADEKAIRKIFIEPHLKTRLGLTSPKIRFHGCQAVRHDDHIHIQLR
jgi:hypothetical protein